MTNEDCLKKFQARISTLDDLNAYIMNNIPYLLEDEVKQIYSKKLTEVTVKELEIAKKSFKWKTYGRLLSIGTSMEVWLYEK